MIVSTPTVIAGLVSLAGIIVSLASSAALKRGSDDCSKGCSVAIRRLCRLRSFGRLLAIAGMVVALLFIAGRWCKP